MLRLKYILQTKYNMSLNPWFFCDLIAFAEESYSICSVYPLLIINYYLVENSIFFLKLHLLSNYLVYIIDVLISFQEQRFYTFHTNIFLIRKIDLLKVSKGKWWRSISGWRVLSILYNMVLINNQVTVTLLVHALLPHYLISSNWLLQVRFDLYVHNSL